MMAFERRVLERSVHQKFVLYVSEDIGRRKKYDYLYQV